jgi:hypothetical protein
MPARIDALAPLRAALGLEPDTDEPQRTTTDPGVLSAAKDPVDSTDLAGALRANRSGPSLSTDEDSPAPGTTNTIKWNPKACCKGTQVGPHNRCSNSRRWPASRHGTYPPAGYLRCVGDPGCEFRILSRHVARGSQPLCPTHQDLAWSLAPTHAAEDWVALMGY